MAYHVNIGNNYNLLLDASNKLLIDGLATTTIRYWSGSSWVVGTLKYWNGSTFATGSVKYWNGSTWTQVN